MSVSYVVFERTLGSKCWTLAYKEHWSDKTDTMPAIFSSRLAAKRWVRDVHSKRLGFWGGKPDQRMMEAHIAEVQHPS